MGKSYINDHKWVKCPAMFDETGGEWGKPLRTSREYGITVLKTEWSGKMEHGSLVGLPHQ
jgi:hypothetical protein